jgi:hypothetical protein
MNQNQNRDRRLAVVTLTILAVVLETARHVNAIMWGIVVVTRYVRVTKYVRQLDSLNGTYTYSRSEVTLESVL